MSDNLFVGIYPGGIVYADRSKEENGDYKQVAFLPYNTLELRIDAPRSPLLAAAREDAAIVQSRRGDLIAVDACGHTVRLGGAT